MPAGEDDEGAAVEADGVFEQPCQLAVAEWHVASLLLHCLWDARSVSASSMDFPWSGLIIDHASMAVTFSLNVSTLAKCIAWQR